MYSLVKLLYWNKPKKMFLENAWKIPAKKNHVRICFSKILLKLKVIFSLFLKLRNSCFQEKHLFSEEKIDCFRPSFSFWLKGNFRMMTSNKRVHFRENRKIVRIKSYPEDALKDKGKKASFRKSCKSFKIVDGHLT